MPLSKSLEFDQKAEWAVYYLNEEGIVLEHSSHRSGESHTQEESPASGAAGAIDNNILGQGSCSSISDDRSKSILHWIKGGTWPLDYFWQEDDMAPALGKKRSESSLRSKQSESPSVSFREGKNPLVRDRLYEDTLRSVGVYMNDIGVAPLDTCKDLCQTLLSREQTTVKDSLFSDNLFEKTMTRLHNENEAMVVQDIFPLIVPRAEILYTYGADELKHLVGQINQAWYGCVPVAPGPAPQPDYAVGFKDTAFTPSQCQKLQPFIEGWKNTPFLATSRMHFPFLTCEVKCGNAALDIADRQNAHNGSVAVKQVVNLYREISREKDLHRTILAFSVSHSLTDVRIYGHYASIDGEKTSFLREPITQFNIIGGGGRDRWIAHKFVKNIYDVFVPAQLERIRTALDQLPDPKVQRAHILAQHELIQLQSQQQSIHQQIREYLLQQQLFQQELNLLQQQHSPLLKMEQLQKFHSDVIEFKEQLLKEQLLQNMQRLEELEPELRPLQLKLLQRRLKPFDQQLIELENQLQQCKQSSQPGLQSKDPTLGNRDDAALGRLPGGESQSERSMVESGSQPEQGRSLSSLPYSQELEPDTPSSQAIQPLFKKPKSKHSP